MTELIVMLKCVDQKVEVLETISYNFGYKVIIKCSWIGVG